ncbi:MAG: ABC transporter permease [Anaerolineae bacterium]|nr:ABC transporter permease [Anaerolineae bacterium]
MNDPTARAVAEEATPQRAIAETEQSAISTETLFTPEGFDAETKYASFWVGAWRRFRRNRLAMFGLVFAALVVAAAVFAPVLTPYDYDKIDMMNGLQPPSPAHPFGTDELGRDILTRILYGARPMLLVGVFTGLAGLAIGVPVGVLAGYLGGVFDWLVTRLIDMFSALPWYLIVLYLVMVLSPSLENLILAMIITGWVGSCRMMRGLTFSIREQDYIEAARALGIPRWRVIVFHVVPQAAPLLLWGFAAGIPTAVFAEAGLSFLGMGVRPPRPSWGRMLTDSGYYWQIWPHMIIFPGLMITLSVLAFQGIADGLRKALDVSENI